eukprot:scaffold45955_cov36-Prasinocladus_malaysianus.AAC.1
MTGIELCVFEPAKKAGKRRSRKVCLRLATKTEANTWVAHLQRPHCDHNNYYQSLRHNIMAIKFNTNNNCSQIDCCCWRL